MPLVPYLCLQRMEQNFVGIGEILSNFHKPKMKNRTVRTLRQKQIRALNNKHLHNLIGVTASPSLECTLLLTSNIDFYIGRCGIMLLGYLKVDVLLGRHGSASLCRDGQKTKWRLPWKY